MSAWSWVARIGGYVAAPFTGGLSIPVGEGIAQGLEGQDATNKTNEQLQAGNNQAIDLYKQTLGPAVERGNAAGNTLAGMMGLPMSSSPTAGQAPGAVPLPMVDSATRTKPPDVPANGIAQQRGTLASLGMGPAQSSYRMVRMRSPDGMEEQDVPEQFMDEAIRRGAQRVG